MGGDSPEHRKCLNTEFKIPTARFHKNIANLGLFYVQPPWSKVFLGKLIVAQTVLSAVDFFRVHLKHARRHFERNLVKDVHRRSVASRNWLKC